MSARSVVRVVTAGPEEARLFNVLRGIQRAYPDERPNVVGAAKGINMAWPKAVQLLEQWERLGWWEYGASIRTGWFTERAPHSLVTKRVEEE